MALEVTEQPHAAALFPVSKKDAHANSMLLSERHRPAWLRGPAFVDEVKEHQPGDEEKMRRYDGQAGRAPGMLTNASVNGPQIAKTC